MDEKRHPGYQKRTGVRLLNINREILRLSLPAIVSNITVPLLGICDTAISGHLGSELYLAAIAVGSMMLNVIFWLFGFLRMGTTGLTATAFGRQDDAEVCKVFARAFFLGIFIGGILTALQRPILGVMLAVINPEPEVASLVREYFLICIWEAPSLLATMAISGWFVGMQSTAVPMAIAISVNVINIIVSFLLVFCAGLGFVGVAIGTVSANWAGLAIGLWAAVRFRRGKKLWCPLRDVVKGSDIRRFFSVNANLFFRSMCITAVSLGVTAAGARLGAMTLAVNAVLMQFFTFFSFFMDGFAFSAEALTGRWYGARDYAMARRGIRALLGWALGVALLFTLLYCAGSGWAASMLTDEAAVREGVREMRVWIWLLPLASVWAFIYDGFYVGITDTGKMLLATLSASVIFFIVAFVRIGDGGLSIETVSNHYLWGAFIAYLLLRGVILASMWRRELSRALARVP